MCEQQSFLNNDNSKLLNCNKLSMLGRKTIYITWLFIRKFLDYSDTWVMTNRHVFDILFGGETEHVYGASQKV